MTKESVIEDRRFQFELAKLQIQSQDNITLFATVLALGFTTIVGADGFNNPILRLSVMGVGLFLIVAVGERFMKPKIRLREEKYAELERLYMNVASDVNEEGEE